MAETVISFGSYPDESGVARLDRQQVATDIGRIAKMLALSSMMLPTTQLFDKGDTLYKYSELIRDYTKQITSETIGDEYTEFKDGDYRKYYPNVPDSFDRIIDYAGMIIAKLIDGVMVARFLEEKNICGLQQYLEQIEKVVSDFNKYANSVHKIADITYIEKDEGKPKI